jgi:NifU-like protein involved in Fe-S cluster formation
LPGGAIAQTAFDVAVNLAKGKNLSEAALAAARERLPGGKIGQAAFDAAIALAQGKKIQDAAFQAAGRMLPSSPYATDALAFARRVAAGENIQKAALSVAGQRVFQKMNHLEGVQKAAAAARSALPKGLTAQAAANTAIRSARQNLQQQRR